MVAVWQQTVPPTGDQMEIGADGFLFDIRPPSTYTISQDGLQLDWGVQTFDRIGGTGNTVIGVWESDDLDKEEYDFRADGTYTNHQPPKLPDPSGTYQVVGSKLGTREIRSAIDVNGAELDWYGKFSGDTHYNWAINIDEMTWTDLLDANNNRTFVRV